MGEQQRLPTQDSADFYIPVFKIHDFQMERQLKTLTDYKLKPAHVWMDVSPNKSKNQLWPNTFRGARKPSQVSAARQQPSAAQWIEREGKTRM